MDHTDVARNITSLMKAKGMSQRDIAEKMNLTQTSVSITIKRNIQIDTLIKFAEALDVHPSELLADNDDNAITPPDLSPTPSSPEIICPRCGERICLSVKASSDTDDER